MIERHIISTEQAPQAIGPYSQAIRAGQLIYTSGQIPLDLNGEVVTGGIEAQTEQVFKNLQAVLAAAGSNLDHVIKATVYLHDMNDFNAFNAIYAQYFSKNKPARTTVEVSRLPKDVLVEIDLISAYYVE